SNDVLDYGGATPGKFNLDFDGGSIPTNLHVVHAASGDDRFACAIGAAPVLRFFATAGNDDIEGNSFFDAVIHGGKGDDALGVSSSIFNSYTEHTATTLFGETGNDSLYASGED